MHRGASVSASGASTTPAPAANPRWRASTCATSGRSAARSPRRSGLRPALAAAARAVIAAPTSVTEPTTRPIAAVMSASRSWPSRIPAGPAVARVVIAGAG